MVLVWGIWKLTDSCRELQEELRSAFPGVLVSWPYQLYLSQWVSHPLPSQKTLHGFEISVACDQRFGGAYQHWHQHSFKLNVKWLLHSTYAIEYYIEYFYSNLLLGSWELTTCSCPALQLILSSYRPTFKCVQHHITNKGWQFSARLHHTKSLKLTQTFGLWKINFSFFVFFWVRNNHFTHISDIQTLFIHKLFFLFLSLQYTV